jgi:hypothetical protein
MISIEQATARDADAICRIDATVLGDIGRNGQLRQWIAAGRCYAARQANMQKAAAFLTKLRLFPSHCVRFSCAYASY